VVVVVTAITLIGLAAWAGGSAGADHACDLLSTSDVEDLLGVPANGGYEDTDRSHGTYCEWRSEDSDDGGDASSPGETVPYFISVEYEQSTRAAQSFESGRARAEGKRRELRGLGDAAYFDGRHGLEVRRGDQVFSTYAAGNNDHPLSNAESRDIERRAADVVIDRIADVGDNPDLDEALECGRTGRCSGTRYRACDLLEESEIEEVTEWTVTDVNGTAVPTDTETAGLCSFYLENPNPADERLREVRRVEVRVEPDRDEAEAAYREDRRGAYIDSDTHEIPELGATAFYWPLFEEVILIHDGIHLLLSYEAELEPEDTAGAIAAEQDAIELAGLARDRLDARSS
jgi:hypothetical protein